MSVLYFCKTWPNKVRKGGQEDAEAVNLWKLLYFPARFLMVGIFASCPILSLISWQGGGGGALIWWSPPPPQQIKTTEFQFSQWANFQEYLKVIEIWSPTRMLNNHLRNTVLGRTRLDNQKNYRAYAVVKMEMRVLIFGLNKVFPSRIWGESARKMLIAVETSCCPPTWEFSELGKAREKFEEKFKRRLMKSSRKNWRKV